MASCIVIRGNRKKYVMIACMSRQQEQTAKQVFSRGHTQKSRPLELIGQEPFSTSALCCCLRRNLAQDLTRRKRSSFGDADPHGSPMSGIIYPTSLVFCSIRALENTCNFVVAHHWTGERQGIPAPEMALLRTHCNLLAHLVFIFVSDQCQGLYLFCPAPCLIGFVAC